MRKSILVLTVLSLVATFAVAGEKTYKKKQCSHDIQKCLNYQLDAIKGTAWDGIHVEGLDSDEMVKVVEVVPDSPGERAGIKAGDYLVAMDGKKLATMRNADLVKAMKSLKVDAVVTYTIKSEGKKSKVKVSMTPPPEEFVAKWVGKHMVKHHAQTSMASY